MASGLSRSTLEQAIRAAELVELRSPMGSARPVLLTAISGALAREIHLSRSQLPGQVEWVAVSLRPLESASWLALEVGQVEGGDVSAPVPIPMEFPADYLQSLFPSGGAFGDKPAVRRLRVSSLPSFSDSTVVQAVSILTRRSRLQLPVEKETLDLAWVMGSAAPLNGPDQAHADAALEKVESILTDRLNFGMGAYRPIASVLASVDDGFQEALLRAREVDGLPEFLDRLSAGRVGLEGAVAVRPAIEARDPERDPANSSTLVTPWPKRSTILQVLSSIYDKESAKIELHYRQDHTVKTVYGEWSSMAEIENGLVDRRVVLQVCGSHFEAHSALRRFFAERNWRRGSLNLVVLCVGDLRGDAARLADIWGEGEGVYFESV